ncbi:gametocyte-specific factor 1 homolog [Drosophila hydei]|uniref:Gametocyte-specific factor 1 homolog n=1 Tax=Drosophila hydei TaxID=7224 RepID=A0A6J1MEQ6_DROHY|nr:gametocyte-specific factor 1 homolog [Drosophila hydei]
MSSSRNKFQASNLAPFPDKAKQKPGSDFYMKCPYDDSHCLLPSRFAWHLTRCARNHTNSGIIRCPFNDTHLLQRYEMPEHVLNCPNRRDFVRFLQPDALPPEEPRPSTVDLVESSENWDDEPPAATYDPKEYCEKNLIIRQLVGAMRRTFRELERNRFQQIMQGKK